MNKQNVFYQSKLTHFRSCDEDDVLLMEELINENINKTLIVPPLPKKLNLIQNFYSPDDQANATLAQYNMDYLTAVKSPQTGSSLFNAVSIALYGNAEYALMLQYQTCVWYGMTAKGFHSCFPELNKNVSRFEVAKSLIACNFKANALTIPVISNALNISITSIYPPHNGLFDPEHRSLNQTFHPLFHKPETHVTKQIYLLWEGDQEFVLDKKSLWIPSRFVCCARVSSDEPEPSFYRQADLDKMIEARNEEVYAKKLAKQGVEPEKGANPRSLDEFKGINQSQLPTVRHMYNYVHFCKNVYEEMPQINCPEKYFNFVVQLEDAETLKDDRFLWKKEKFRRGYHMRGNFLQLYLEADGYHFSKAHFAGQRTRQEPQPAHDDVINVSTHEFEHLSTSHLRKTVTVLEDKKGFGVRAFYEYFNELGALINGMDLN